MSDCFVLFYIFGKRFSVLYTVYMQPDVLPVLAVSSMHALNIQPCIVLNIASHLCDTKYVQGVFKFVEDKLF